MPTFDSDTYTAQQERKYKRNVAPSARDLQQQVRYFVPAAYVALGTEAADDIIRLGTPELEGAIFIPELSRVLNTNGDLNLAVKIQKVEPGASAVDLSGAATITTAPVAFARAADTVPATLASKECQLQAYLTAVTSFTVGEELTFELAFRVPEL